jgi:AAA15 family ATPase/GTPase
MRLPNEGAPTTCLGLYGANASGKSNIVGALSTFRDIVIYREIDNYFPNKIHCKENASFFELKVVIEQNTYTYSLLYNSVSIIEEELKCDDTRLYKIKNDTNYAVDLLDFAAITRENYSSEKLEDIFKVECTDQAGQQAPFLAVLGKNYAGLNAKIRLVFNYFLEKLITYTEDTPTHLLNNIEEVSTIIKRLDIDIKFMSIEKKDLKNSHAYIIYTYHTGLNDELVRFELAEESLGTKIMVRLLSTILVALNAGGVLLIDELDASLHPLLLQEIIRLFKDDDYNTKGTQLIFTAHDTNILKEGLMNAAELGIVTKIQKDGTTIARAIDYDITGDEDLQQAYLKGDFGGIPFPYI